MLRSLKSQSHKVTKSPVARDLFLCLLSAVLLILSFPGFNLEFLAWVGFIPLFLALRNKSKIKAFLLSYLTGVIFWAGIIYWLVHVTLPGTVILILYLALYFGFFGLIIQACSLQLAACSSLFFIPSLWVILEYVRSYLFTGLPWALLGYSQYLNLPVIQIADITGAWGVSFLVMMANVALSSWFPPQADPPTAGIAHRKDKRIVTFILILTAVVIYGYVRIYNHKLQAPSSTLQVAVVQGDIPQELKWDYDAQGYIVDEYARLTEEAAKENPDLIVWPEAASPVVFGEDDELFKNIFDLSKRIKASLLTGSVAKNKEDYFNSAFLIEGGRITEEYSKLHLVPFGEYVPLKSTFPFLETIAPIGDITPGKEWTVFKINALQASGFTPQVLAFSLQPLACSPFSVLICFEDLFPELSRGFVRKGARLLINITNDAWYKQTSAPYQHLQASVFRAIENRVWVVRAANTGISAFIDPVGKVVSKVQSESGEDIFVSGFAVYKVGIPDKADTLYNHYGDVFVFLCFLFSLYAIIASLRIKR